jgi:hypothetical protein
VRTLVLLLSVAILAVVAWPAAVGGSSHRYSDYLPPSTFSTDPTPVRLLLNGHRLTFSRAHLQYQSQWAGGPVSEIFVNALLPDFEPPTKANLQEFFSRGYGRQIDVNLKDARRMRDMKAFKAWRFSYIQPRSVTSKMHGLVGFNTGGGAYSGMNIFIPEEPHPDIQFFECDIKIGLIVSPACQTLFFYNPDIHVDYIYSRDFLPQWKEIHEGVRRFIAQHSEN